MYTMYKFNLSDRLQSETISWLRFPLTVGVVFIHDDITIGQNNGVINPFWFECIVRLFSDVLPRVCVPLFFIISGYLFFYGVKNLRSSYLSKIKRRFRTLFIPYVVWNILALLSLLVMSSSFFSNYSATREFQFSIKSFLSVFWNFEGTSSPLNFPLWFIRDLMLLILFSPIIKLFIKYLRWGIVAITGLCWFFNLEIGDMVPRCYSIFFFMLGSFMSINGDNLLQFSRKYGMYAIVVYPCIAIIDMFTKGAGFNIYIHHIGIIVGIIGILFVVPLFLSRGKLIVHSNLSGSSFFIFAFHSLIIYKIIMLMYRVMDLQSPYLLLFVYFSVPIVVIGIAWSFWWILKNKTPMWIASIFVGHV